MTKTSDSVPVSVSVFERVCATRQGGCHRRWCRGSGSTLLLQLQLRLQWGKRFKLKKHTLFKVSQKCACVLALSNLKIWTLYITNILKEQCIKLEKFRFGWCVCWCGWCDWLETLQNDKMLLFYFSAKWWWNADTDTHKQTKWQLNEPSTNGRQLSDAIDAEGRKMKRDEQK